MYIDKVEADQRYYDVVLGLVLNKSYYSYYFNGTKDRNFIWFIKRLEAFGKIESDDADMALGIYFGYPKCCISNFISLHKENISAIFSYMESVYGKDDYHPGYVRCAKCRGKDKRYLTN